MRKLYYYMAAALLLIAAGCQREEIASFGQDDDVLEVYASIEDIEDAQTKTYLSGSEVYWSSGDQIAVFYKNTLRKRFDVTPESIDSKDATFVQDEDYVQMGKNDNISHNISYYPFCDVTCAPDGSSYTLSNLALPSTQFYVEGSFGLGAFPMVAVTANTDDVNFCFKNICGVMQFQLTGCGFVKSVSVKGHRGEVLAGPAVVTAGYGKEPSIAMSAEGAKEVTLDCGENGVELNETTPVSFFISLPPVQFEEGFTITVTDTWGGSKEYSTSKKNPVGRSKGLRMPAKEYIGVRPPQEGDYIDEYGVNHGQGIEIDGVVWAPVNCGYKAPTADSKGFPYGKLYQWGRKYGQGYDDNDESYPSGVNLVEGPVMPDVGQSEDSQDKFYYNSVFRYDWSKVSNDQWWNLGAESKPVKTEYDPCPIGWRVPTYEELSKLCVNQSSWTINEEGQKGCWFSGTSVYTDKVPQVFFPGAGKRKFDNGNTSDRGSMGYYWSSRQESGYNAYYLGFVSNSANVTYGALHASSHSVRCVRDDCELIPVSSVTLDMTSVTLDVGQTLDLAATITPSNANHQSILLYSSDESILRTNSKDTFIAVSEGTVTVTAMAGMQTAECVVTVVAEPTVDMSLSGSANCYIVSQKGSYKFKAVKGNSNESVGAVSSSEVLWESFGTAVTPNVGDLVKNVSYNNGEVTFHTADTFKEGNAVIAAKDASGNILWSWHIWLTDEPEEQVYYNNAGTMMDRNLGATSATPGEVGALGLLYQWGRKDPFLGSSSISSGSVAKSTITWPSAVSTSSSKGTVSYVTANPTTFVKAPDSPYDWHYSSRDNTLWASFYETKSIYDPCPPGWCVPNGGDNGVWSKAMKSSNSSSYSDTNEGINFSGLFGSASTIWYPASGYRSYSNGNLKDVGNLGRYWSGSPSTTTDNAFYMLFDYYANVYPSISEDRANGYSVRCVRE